VYRWLSWPPPLNLAGLGEHGSSPNHQSLKNRGRHLLALFHATALIFLHLCAFILAPVTLFPEWQM